MHPMSAAGAIIFSATLFAFFFNFERVCSSTWGIVENEKEERVGGIWPLKSMDIGARSCDLFGSVSSWTSHWQTSSRFSTYSSNVRLYSSQASRFVLQNKTKQDAH